MGNLIIYHSNGEPIEATATITKAEQSQKLLAEDVVNLEIGAKEIVPFSTGDYIQWCGKTYTLNQLPSVTKENTADFHYSTITFESEQYELLDIAWLLPENTYGDSFTGNLKDFLDILIENTGRSGRTWTLGEYPTETDGTYKTLTYAQTNCLNVLQNLCKEWGVEFVITRSGATRILSIKTQIGELFPTRFEYGRTGGAYKIDRKTVTNQNVITRLFVFGSDKNLPSDYRSNKLCLPSKTRNESYITDAESVRYYGIKENVKVFSDIFPARYGTVTAIDAENKKIFFDSSMDFDLNEKDEYGTKWLIPSTVAKIQFNSGGLAGYSFDLSEYDHETKRFKIKTYTDANGLQFPNENSAAFQIKVGDEYFIYDIRLPQSYVEAAETKLQTEGQKYYNENCRPHVNYAISISSLFLKHLYGDSNLTNEIFKVGDSIEIYDFDLELLKTLRIAGFTRNLLKPYEFTLTLSENVEVQTQFQRVMGELTDIKNLIYTNDIAAADNARRNWLAMQDVINSAFDPEGYYYSDKIKPLSIETTMLAVGARSQQFVLKDVTFEANYNGSPNAIHNTAGTLDHYTIAEPDIRTWQITQNTATDLGPNTVYYIYAKCLREGNTGLILYDNVQRTVESDPQFYYFLVGTLTTVITDTGGTRPARNIALTYGSTTINGRFITTGRIQSGDGSTYFDLDANEIGGKILFKDGIITQDLTLIGGTAGVGGANEDYAFWAGNNLMNKSYFRVLKNGRLEVRDNIDTRIFGAYPDTKAVYIQQLRFERTGNLSSDAVNVFGKISFENHNVNFANDIKVGGKWFLESLTAIKNFIPAAGKFNNSQLLTIHGSATTGGCSFSRANAGYYCLTINNVDLRDCLLLATVNGVSLYGDNGEQMYVAGDIYYTNGNTELWFTVGDDASANDLTDENISVATINREVHFALLRCAHLWNL